MGLKAYRFSIAWPRVLPTLDGGVNEKGLAYYDRLTDALLEKDIQPWPTLYHWDHPQELEAAYGGWESRETVKRFGEFAAVVAERLSDRVKQFFTINEFGCFTNLGYGTGHHAPGKRLPPKRLNRIRHNALLGHGTAVQALRANAKAPIRIGLADNPAIPVPVIETEEHIEACRKAIRQINAPFLTAVLEGRYMQEYLDQSGDDAPEFTDEEMKLIATPLDFVGFNCYSATWVRADDSPAGFAVVRTPDSYPTYNLPWLKLCPQIAYWGPRLVREVWNPAEIYITENGASCDDKLTEDGRIEDPDRVLYLRNHFLNAHRAVSEGVPLRGYFVWSLLDNFEWFRGYAKRFGLIYVNYYNDLQRIPKLSAHYFREVCRRNAAV